MPWVACEILVSYYHINTAQFYMTLLSCSLPSRGEQFDVLGLQVWGTDSEVIQNDNVLNGDVFTVQAVGLCQTVNNP